MKAKQSKTTKVYAYRFPKSPESRWYVFKEKMNAYAEKLKKELIK
jgi:hypothetical protein